MKSSAATPADYLAALPAERQGPVRKLRQVLKQHLPKGFKETMEWPQHTEAKLDIGNAACA